MPALVIALGPPLGAVLGVAHAPWAPPDQVLRRADLVRTIDVLDPSADPELIVMSHQTFYLLLPFYPSEREAAVFSADSSAFHFPYGERRVLVSRAWNFTLSSGQAAVESDVRADMRQPAPGAADAAPGHLGTFLRTVEHDFPSLDVTGRDRAVLLVGGWRPPFVDELGARSATEPFVLESRTVPGFFAFLVNPHAMVAALAAEPSPSGGA